MTGHQPPIEVVDQAECVRLLRSVSFGRLVWTVDAMPVVQPVNFVIRGDTVVVRTASESKLAVAAINHVVAFEADQIDTQTRAGWSVTVVGRSYEMVDPADLEELALIGPEAWGRPASARVIAIRIERITGRWLHSPAVTVR